MNRLLKFPLLLFLSLKVYCQQPLFTHAIRFGVEDGLPQSFISSLAQDKQGFLWIGTRDGLARYDGRQFRVFRRNREGNIIYTDLIQGIFCDSKDRLWINYENTPVYCFDTKTYESKSISNFPILDSIFRMGGWSTFYERNDIFWSLKPGGGLYAADLLNNRIKEYSFINGNLHSDAILGMAVSRKGTIWLLHPDGLEYSDSSGSIFRYIPFPPSLLKQDNTIIVPGLVAYPMVVLPDGRVMAGIKDHIISYDQRGTTFSEISLQGEVSGIPGSIQAMMTGNDGRLYVENYGRIFRYDENGTFSCLWDYPNTEYHYAQSIMIDKSNVCWFGTNASGLYKIDFSALPLSSSGYKKSFHADVFSILFAREKVKAPAPFMNLKESYNLRYSYNSKGVLCFTGFDNTKLSGDLVYVYRHGNITALPCNKTGLSNIPALAWGPNDEIWGITIDKYLCRWNDLTKPPLVTKLDSISGGAILDMEIDKDGGLWAITGGSGVYYFKEGKLGKKYSFYDKNNFIPSDRFTDMITDPENSDLLWIGTLGQGLLLLDKHKGFLRQFTMKEGLPNNTIYALVPDKYGYIWYSSNLGIGRIHHKNFDVKNFDIRDGLPENEFNRFHSFLFPDGRIAFGGPRGFTVFDPSNYKEDRFATTVMITQLKINNKVVEYGDSSGLMAAPVNELKTLVLPYYKNFLSIEFAGMQFNQPLKINYRYRLEGYDKDWITTGNQNIASYTKLPPGHYKLLINASNTSGIWSNYIREFSIHIRPPLWATWWAYTIYALVLIFLVRLYWGYRSRQARMENEIALEQSRASHLKEIDEIKDRFFANITHELRTPLTLIYTPFQQMKDDPRFNEDDRRIFSNAFSNASQLLRIINQLLDISKIESKQMKVYPTVGDLQEFVKRCAEQFYLSSKEKNIDLRFSASGLGSLYLFDHDKWEKIIFNLVGNAIKFTGTGGTVTLSLGSLPADKPDTEQIIFEVRDTGKGMPAAELERIFDRFFRAEDTETSSIGGTGIGLSLVKELTELMGGEVTVESKPGEGSAFRVCIPVCRMRADSTGPVIKEQEIEEGPAAAGGGPGTGSLVLVVEDNRELRTFICENLGPDHRILSADNGTDAWEVILRELPDVVVSDMMMPGMTGTALCEKVKGDKRSGHIGFILLTAKAAQDSRLEGLRKGADAYLTKPFNLEELKQKVQNLLLQQDRMRTHLQATLLPVSPLTSVPNVNDIFIQEITAYLDEHLDDPQFSVEKLSRAMAMSPRSLHRKLRSLIGLSPVEFIRQYRLQKAAILLSSGHPISEAAFAVGFETASYFSQCFKEQFGSTPSEFARAKKAD